MKLMIQQEKISEIELAWLAGLLEGEGSFCKAPPSESNRPRISLQMTDKDVVEKVAKMFGVAYMYPRRHVGTTWKQCFQVVLRGKRAIELMKHLYPYMGERRKSRIDEVIASYTEKPADIAKLTNEAVRDIRSKRMSMRKFATFYGVAKGTIQRVQQRNYYRHVT